MLRVLLPILLSVPQCLLAAAAGDEFFERRVRPLLVEHCTECHGDRLQSASIDFTDPSTVLGSAVVSGDESSPLIRAVRYESAVKMPPTSRLPQDRIDILVQWVRMGAPWPGHEPEQPGTSVAEEDHVDSSHWAFQPLADPPVPDVDTRGWARNGIDRFVLARMRKRGLAPAPEADLRTLLRRAKFDLLGLPPDDSDLSDFIERNRAAPLQDFVETLLASPHYGERWGRHWLDVARYADSTGVDEDHPFGDSWRYRDYVVSAFNQDLPFNQFVREQVAGDLLPGPGGSAVNAGGVIAAGFLALGPMALAQRDPVQKKYDVVDEQIDTLSKTFLGLTVACARCHDHKFDPILTSDYYALAAILASTRTFDDWTRNGSRYYKHPLVPQTEYARYKAAADAVGRLERIRGVAAQAAVQRFVLAGPGRLVADHMLSAAQGAGSAAADEETATWFREYLEPRPSPRPHLARWREADEDGKAAAARQYQAELREILETRSGRLAAWTIEALRDFEAAPDEPLKEAPQDLATSLLYRDLFDDGAPFDLDYDDVKSQITARSRASIEALDARIAKRQAALPPEPPMANSVTEGEPVRQRIFVRGQHRNQGRPVSKRFPLVLAGANQPPIESGSGRRELADWLASEANPLTARVIVNRIWLWHFGEGLVRTPNNFGLRGEAPTHPLLLDWLASRFIESGWSIKQMHRLIMNSATYRASSSISQQAWDADPENGLWSRFERRRLTVEELRDGYLMLSGSLDRAVGGDTDLGSGKLAEFVRNNRRIDPDDYLRRSLYLPLMRNKLPSLLGLFDFGDATTATGKRSVTNVPPQALYLTNSDFALGAAAGLAERLSGRDEQKIVQAYLRILSRQPTDLELGAAADFVRVHSGGRQAWSSLCKTLLASNEFHFVE